MHKVWILIWFLIVIVAFVSGCKGDDRSSPLSTPKSQPKAAEQQGVQPTLNKTETKKKLPKRTAVQNHSQEKSLYDQLKEHKTISPGMTIDLAQIPEPTEKELADPRMNHLNPATKRTLVMFRKLQQKVPQLSTGTNNTYGSTTDKANMFKP